MMASRNMQSKLTFVLPLHPSLPSSSSRHCSFLSTLALTALRSPTHPRPLLPSHWSSSSSPSHHRLSPSAPFSAVRMSSSSSNETGSRNNVDGVGVRTVVAPEIKQLTLLWDSECPLCKKEVDWLESKNSRLEPDQRMVFVDIAGDDFVPNMFGGITYREAMKSIHCLEPIQAQHPAQAQGHVRVLTGIKAFQVVYNKLGMGWVYAAADWPLVGPALDWVYALWASKRVELSGRGAFESVVQAKEKREKLRKEQTLCKVTPTGNDKCQ